MTARKKLVSAICIISLVLAITAGVLLSVGAQSNGDNYVGGSVNLVNTGVTINANSSTMGGGADKPAEAPADAVAISNATELQNFLSSSETYGYLTADIVFNASGVGSSVGFAQGRTINGNGWTVTLQDDNGTAPNYRDSFGTLGGMDYGMFVAFNEGTIKNFKFKYNMSGLTIGNNSAHIVPNYVGFVCGTNATTGVISNCDLDVSGSFTYNYTNGSLAIEEFNSSVDSLTGNAFSINFGGVAGRNAGTITYITAQYTNFTSTMKVTAANKTSIWSQRANATIRAGGIAGTMHSKDSEISNVILAGSATFNMTSTNNQNTGISERARNFNIAAAVVGSNSAYSRAEGGIGKETSTQGLIDNIILGLTLSYAGSGLGMQGEANSGNGGSGVSAPSEQSINAVVFCGKATNVTILNKTDKIVSSQNVDYQTDHCNCGIGTNSGDHETGYGNVINTGDYSDVELSMNPDGAQIIKVTPKDTHNSVLGELRFNKYLGRNADAEAGVLQSPTGEDTSDYGTGVPKNDITYLYNLADVRQDSYTFMVSPYQSTSAKYWEVNVYCYQIADISEANDLTEGWANEYTYNGFDFLTQQLKFTTKDNSKSGIVNPAGFYAVSSGEDQSRITSARLPGEYSFTLQEKEAGLSYVSIEDRVVVFASDTASLTPFVFKVKNAEMQIKNYTVDWLANNWLSEKTDFEFELINGLEGSADGYVYEVNGSEYRRTGLMITNDTSTKSRTYTVYLTSGGAQVTNPIVYTVKVDLENPILSIPRYEHPADIYYTHNRISIDAQDDHSGVASLYLYSYNKETGELEHSHNIIEECTTGSNDQSYIDKDTGYYVWYFQDTGRKVIEVTDNAGRKSSFELDVKIDTFVPTISVDAYYMADVPGLDSDGQQIITPTKTPYDGGEVEKAVYFDVTAQFGEAGGEIQYSYDNEHWYTYTDTLTVKESADVYFRALSNTYDHPAMDSYPYNRKYQLTTYWEKNVQIGSDGITQVVVPFKVTVVLETVIITIDDVIISGTTKTFDGTDKFEGTIEVTDEFKAKINGDIIFTVAYKDVNASDEAMISISAVCTDDTKILDSQISDYIGRIEKKEISVVIDSKDKYYGYSLPELTYTAYGMIPGFEETVEIYVVKGEGCEHLPYELLPQTERDETKDGYVITVVEGMTFKNYVLPEANITIGKLHIDLAPIDRLVYNKGEFTGLDTKNIATRNLEIGFTRANGNYEKLNVKFERRVYITGNDGSLRETYELQEDMTVAPAGFYRVTISLPEFDAVGGSLWSMYELDSKIATFMIKVINASVFDKEEEEKPPVDDTNKTDSDVVNNGSQIGIYENGSTTNPDSTDMPIDSTKNKTRDYVAMISIFCAVLIVIAFAIGVGRAIIKRAKR